VRQRSIALPGVYTTMTFGPTLRARASRSTGRTCLLDSMLGARLARNAPRNAADNLAGKDGPPRNLARTSDSDGVMLLSDRRSTIRSNVRSGIKAPASSSSASGFAGHSPNVEAYATNQPG
jgi:hypothetical protein